MNATPEKLKNRFTPVLTTIVGMEQIQALMTRGWRVEIVPHHDDHSLDYFLHMIAYAEKPLEKGQAPLQTVTLRHPDYPGDELIRFRNMDFPDSGTPQDPKTTRQPTMHQRFLRDLFEIQRQASVARPGHPTLGGHDSRMSALSGGPA